MTPKASWGWVKAMLHSIYDQPETEAVAAQFDRVIDAVIGAVRSRVGRDVHGSFTVAQGRGLVVAVPPDTEAEAAGNQAMLRPAADVDAPRATTALRSASDLYGLFDLLVP